MPTEAELFAHGSRWVRADFHLHTRGDREFADAGQERDFVTRYVSALKRADIKVGIITNHNKFEREEFTALRKAARMQRGEAAQAAEAEAAVPASTRDPPTRATRTAAAPRPMPRMRRRTRVFPSAIPARRATAISPRARTTRRNPTSPIAARPRAKAFTSRWTRPRA